MPASKKAEARKPATKYVPGRSVFAESFSNSSSCLGDCHFFLSWYLGDTSSSSFLGAPHFLRSFPDEASWYNKVYNIEDNLVNCTRAIIAYTNRYSSRSTFKSITASVELMIIGSY